MNRHHIYHQIILAALVVVVFIAKWLIWYFTSSLAVFTDALEGLVNLFAVFLSLTSAYISSKPKDKSHPYGHGKIEFIAGITEGFILFLAGVYVCYESIINLQSPQHIIRHIDGGIIFLIIISILQGLVGTYLFKQGKKSKNYLLTSSAKHVLTDAYTTVILLVGLILILFTGWWWLDIIFALAITIWIWKNAYQIIRPGLGGILDEANTEVLQEFINFLNEHRQKDWIDIHKLRVIRYGMMLHIDCHLTLPFYWSLEKAHAVLNHFENMIRKHYKDQVEIFSHTDPCIPACCSSCMMGDCAHRQFPFQEKINWEIDSIVEDKKHQHANY